MARRITSKNLDNLVEHLNKLTGNPIEPYTKTGKPQAGAYLLDSAYGGWALHRMVEGGGESDVLRSGHVPARELFNLIHAYLRGMEAQGLYNQEASA